MDRRNFLRRAIAGMAGTTATIALSETGAGTAADAATETQCVTYRVQGFSCETCAVGLETMLLQRKGVIRVRATYSDARVVIGFDDNLTTYHQLREFIASCGFSIA